MRCSPRDLLALRGTCRAASELLGSSERVWLAKLRESFGLHLRALKVGCSSGSGLLEGGEGRRARVLAKGVSTWQMPRHVSHGPQTAHAPSRLPGPFAPKVNHWQPPPVACSEHLLEVVCVR